MRNVASGNIFYYAEDMLGSSRTILQDGQSSPCYDADFYPYGGERDIMNTCPQNYKFEGKERDAETNNDDFGARYYSSRLGRWLSADWSSVPAPVPYANLTNPQTLNLYAMVRDNPETFADLDGHILSGSDGETSESNAGNPVTNSEGCGGAGSACNRTPQQAAQPPTPSPSPSQSTQTGQDQVDEVIQQMALQRRQATAQLSNPGPEPGSPEYVKELSTQISAESKAGEKYILAPVAVADAVVMSAAVATSATAEVVASAGYKAVMTTAATAPQAVQFAQGVEAGMSHTPGGSPPTFMGGLGWIVGSIISRLYTH